MTMPGSPSLRYSVLLCITFMLGAAAPAAGQLAGLAGTPLLVEGRVFAGFPTGDFGRESDVQTGLGFGVEAAYNFTPTLALYAGYSRLRFGVEGGGDSGLVDSGVNAGLRYTLPVVQSLVPYLRGGLVYHQIELDAAGGNFSTDHGLGFDIGGGLAVPLSPRLSVHPSVSYVAYSPNVDESNFDVSYITLGASLAYRF